MDMYASEILGPATVIHPVESTDASVDLANNAEYRLTGGVISRDLNAAFGCRCTRQERDHPHQRSRHCRRARGPFCGAKNSGYGKLGGTAGIAAFTEQRWITSNTAATPAWPRATRLGDRALQHPGDPAIQRGIRRDDPA
jgi:benzaldehyde dehydrogenase (NAD)